MSRFFAFQIFNNIAFIYEQNSYHIGMIGFYNINKPVGPTSHSVVYKIKRQLPGRKTKVGHAGTLDPFASGVLIVCVGGATRIAQYVQSQPKRYTADITLGKISTTADPEGEITDVEFDKIPSLEDVQNAIPQFVGKIMQVPPIHSAIQIDGVRAYQLARAGEDIELPAREIEIYEINVLDYQFPKLTIDVKCGSGTYIRSLARDIGQVLGTGGYCSGLVRTEIGKFKLENAIDLKLTDPQGQLENPADYLDWPVIEVSDEEQYQLFVGVAQKLPAPMKQGEQVFLVDTAKNLIGIGIVKEDGLSAHPRRVFIPRQEKHNRPQNQ